MSAFSSFVAPVRRSLSENVEQLRSNLDALSERLRESIAHSVALAVARAVREVVSSLLSQRDVGAMQSSRFRHRYEQSSQFWDEREYEQEPPWYEDRDEFLGDPRRQGGFARDPDSKPQAPHQRRVCEALVAGGQAVVWWLRRTTSKLSALSALGIGLVATAATYAFGRWAKAGAWVIGSIVGMLNLVDAARSATSLADPETS